MKPIGLLAILTRAILLSVLLIKFGIDIATYVGVFLIATDLTQIRTDIKGERHEGEVVVVTIEEVG